MSSLLDRGHAALYVLSQRLVGADLARRECIEALAPQPGDRILDIGCGPAYYFDSLPNCEYFGFDTDAQHIASAQNKFGHRGTFRNEPFDENHARELAPFDKVLLLGLLHHMDDDVAAALLDRVARSMRPSGRVISLDSSFYEGQPRLARFISKNDQGDYVRTPKAFLKLAAASFGRVETRIVGGTWRMPAALFMMILEEPKTRPTST
jgi:SAM-dependent methyltransferase